jgi:uncharacterized membrane protein HdeD (DUF308 family)
VISPFKTLFVLTGSVYANGMRISLTRIKPCVGRDEAPDVGLTSVNSGRRLDARQGGLRPQLPSYARDALTPGQTISEDDMATIPEPMGSETMAPAHGHRWGWLLALGIVQIIAGWIAIAVPVVASFAAVALFGALLIVTAIFQLIHAFRVRSWPRSAWSGLGGVFYGLAGVLVAIYPVSGALALAVMIAILLIADGALRIGFAMMMRPLPGWGWLVAGGLGSVVVGVILLIGWPATALWVTGLLLGINLIFTGSMHIALALASRPGRSANRSTDRFARA